MGRSLTDCVFFGFRGGGRGGGTRGRARGGERGRKRTPRSRNGRGPRKWRKTAAASFLRVFGSASVIGSESPFFSLELLGSPDFCSILEDSKEAERDKRGRNEEGRNQENRRKELGEGRRLFLPRVFYSYINALSLSLSLPSSPGSLGERLRSSCLKRREREREEMQ